MPKQTLPLTDSQCKKLEAPQQLSDGGGLYLQARETVNTGVFIITDQATTNAMKCDWVSILKSA